MQERRERDEAMVRMKDEGIDYDERMDRLQEVRIRNHRSGSAHTAQQYLRDMPWAADYGKTVSSTRHEQSVSPSIFLSYGVSRSEHAAADISAMHTLCCAISPDKAD